MYIKIRSYSGKNQEGSVLNNVKTSFLINIPANIIYKKKDEAPFPQCPVNLEMGRLINQQMGPKRVFTSGCKCWQANFDHLQAHSTFPLSGQSGVCGITGWLSPPFSQNKCLQQLNYQVTNKHIQLVAYIQLQTTSSRQKLLNYN